jgi:hypothetical protein
MMRDIYKRASKTIIWLGEGSDESNNTLALVPQLLRAWELAAVGKNDELDLWALGSDRVALPAAHEQIWFDLFDVLNETGPPEPGLYRSWRFLPILRLYAVTSSWNGVPSCKQ